MLRGGRSVAENLRPDPVIENALNSNSSLYHWPGHRAEFDTDVMVRGEGAQVLVRYEEADPRE